MTDPAVQILAFLVYLLIVLLVFLLFRALVLWYWKVDRVVALLEEIRDNTALGNGIRKVEAVIEEEEKK